MISVLDLENTIGNLLLETGDSLLLETSTEYEAYMLYELDRVEAEFKRIIQLQFSSSVQVLMKRETVTDITPRVELVLAAQGNQLHKNIINAGESNAVFQAFDVWNYQLSATVVTNRETNGSQHSEICGKVRRELQMYRLAQTWAAVLHTVIECIEGAIELSVSEQENCDQTKMNFNGMLSIRSGAWALVS